VRAPSGDVETYVLNGDEWQLDARVLKWRGVANLLGLDARYRLERLGGRYVEIEQERTGPRSVYALGAPPALDLWLLARAYPRWLPFVDAVYGSATYLPMADGARFQVTISQTGWSRAGNDAAQAASAPPDGPTRCAPRACSCCARSFAAADTTGDGRGFARDARARRVALRS
jgi:hypothetical protein